MPRGVLVVLSQHGCLLASSLCSLGSLVFTADLLLEAFHPCGTILTYGVHLALPAPRSGIPLCLSPLYLFFLMFLPYTPHLSYTGSATLSWYTNRTLLDTS